MLTAKGVDAILATMVANYKAALQDANMEAAASIYRQIDELLDKRP